MYDGTYLRKEEDMTPNRRTQRIGMIAIAALALVAVACVCTSLTSTGTPLSCGPDGGDGYTTTGCYTISAGSSGSATLNSLSEAHNWTMQGTSGQTITVRASGQGDCDPRVKLIDSGGSVLAEDDDSGGGANGRDALFTYTLPADGTYYLRVDVFSGGTYDLSVN
jgi:hypothetical protein